MSPGSGTANARKSSSGSFKGTKPTSTNQPKKHIEVTPTGPLGFLNMCLMFVFKRFVFSQTHVKIGIYFGALILCSLLKDFNMLNSRFYLAQKSNFINQYFVKMGWAWTLAVCTPFVIMSSIVYTGFNLNHIRKHVGRLLVATFIWFTFTSLFDVIDSNTGSCLKGEIKNKLECKSSRNEWVNGFDISGHVFILMHSLFLMLEEVKIFNQWEQFHKKLEEKLRKDITADQLSPESEDAIERAEYWYIKLTPYLKINFIVMALLALLWECMLLTTCLFFHTIMHKLLAACFAVGCWFITYKTWYADKNLLFSPGLPGEGIV